MKYTKFIASVGAATASLIAGTGMVVGGATPAGASGEMVLVAHTTNVQIVTQKGSFVLGPDSPPPTTPPAPGDRSFVRDDLSQNGVNVGFDTVICTVTFNNNTLCDVMISINGRGDIHATALVRNGASQGGNSVFDAVIDGGTFAFRGAKGDIHLQLLPNYDLQQTFNIV